MESLNNDEKDINIELNNIDQYTKTFEDYWFRVEKIDPQIIEEESLTGS